MEDKEVDDLIHDAIKERANYQARYLNFDVGNNVVGVVFMVMATALMLHFFG